MTVLGQVKSTIKKFDIFCTTELLRYKADSEYSTAFGGFASILLVGALMTIFSYKLISCFLKEQINARQSVKFTQNPGPLKLSTSQESQFMLAFQIMDVDLSQEYRYFDFVLYYTHPQTGIQSEVELKPCKLNDWIKWPSIAQKFQTWNLGKWVCVPPDINMVVQGTWFSQVMNVAQVYVSKCTDLGNQSLPCVDQDRIDEIFDINEATLILNIYFMNPTINPSDQNYITYDISDSFYMYLTEDQLLTGNIYFQDYQITTDESIFPWTDQETQTGFLVSEPMDDFTLPSDNSSAYDDLYAVVSMLRSKNSRIIERTYVRLDEVLGFIGGLFGTVCIFLVFVNKYSQYAYEISLGNQFFKPESSKNFKNYNFFNFLLHKIYQLLDKIGCTPNWQSTAQFSQCQTEMEKQLDVAYLLERIQFLETVSSALLDSHHLRGLHVRQKLTLEQARKKRRAFKLKGRTHIVRGKVERKMGVMASASQTPFGKQQANADKLIQGSQFFSAQKFKDTQEPTVLQLQENKGQDNKQDNESIYSGSSSDSQKYNHEQENEVIDELIQLNQEASNGNKLSEKVLQVTTKSIQSILPGLLFGNKKIFANVQNIRNQHEQFEDSSKIGPFMINDQRSSSKIMPS